MKTFQNIIKTLSIEQNKNIICCVKDKKDKVLTVIKKYKKTSSKLKIKKILLTIPIHNL